MASDRDNVTRLQEAQTQYEEKKDAFLQALEKLQKKVSADALPRMAEMEQELTLEQNLAMELMQAAAVLNEEKEKAERHRKIEEERSLLEKMIRATSDDKYYAKVLAPYQAKMWGTIGLLKLLEMNRPVDNEKIQHDVRMAKNFTEALDNPDPEHLSKVREMMNEDIEKGVAKRLFWIRDQNNMKEMPLVWTDKAEFAPLPPSGVRNDSTGKKGTVKSKREDPAEPEGNDVNFVPLPGQ